ncbi:MAG: lipase [Phormidesmis sp. RL_2_1]|nr:lipase [Phormidesmis sp. RL_2_1]
MSDGQRPDTQPDIRICFFGDSFVNGAGDPNYLGWSGRACQAADRPHVTYYNLGIRGNTSKQIEARWQAESALRFSADCDPRLVFSFGVNDNCLENGHLRVSPKDAIACARRILSQAKAQCPTLFIGPPPVADDTINDRTVVTSMAYAALCDELSVPYLATYPVLRDNSTWMNEVKATDGAHPSAAGYAVFAQLVSTWAAWQAWFI